MKKEEPSEVVQSDPVEHDMDTTSSWYIQGLDDKDDVYFTYWTLNIIL